MPVGDAELREMEMMAEHEETIGKLYDSYAEKLPEYGHFWTTLADEERTHAAWIRELRKKAEDGSLEFDKGRFRIEAIQTSIRYIEDWTRQAQREQVTMLHALAIAADIENALIDRKFFEVYEPDSEDLKDVLKSLEEASREHRDRVTAMLTRVRQGEPPEATAIG